MQVKILSDNPNVRFSPLSKHCGGVVCHTEQRVVTSTHRCRSFVHLARGNNRGSSPWPPSAKVYIVQCKPSMMVGARPVSTEN